MSQALDQLQEQINQVDLQIQETQTLLTDPDMSAMAQAEILELQAQKSALEASISSMNQDYSKDNSIDGTYNMDSNAAIMEIRGGAGGEEAKLFAEDLLRMYMRFTQVQGYKLENLDEGVVKIKGKLAYGTFKYESGVHRVQRVPVTESSGRIHTSTASIVVLPEVTPTQVQVRDEDLEWKFTRAGGHGGQNVNKVNTAVMMTHKPSGLVVHCRQERSQQQNRALALDMLRSRLWEMEEEKRLSHLDQQRQKAVGRAMRSEKIRTYNYPENRVTDHRIPKTWHNLDRILEGNGLDEIIAAVSEFFEKTSTVEPLT